MITPATAEWQGTKAHLETTINQHIAALIIQRDPIMAAEERGKIAALRAFIAKVEPKKIQADIAPDYNLR